MLNTAEQLVDLAEVHIRNAGRRGFSFRDLRGGACGFLVALLLIGTVAIARKGYFEGLVFTHSPAQLGQGVDGGYTPKAPRPGTNPR